MSGKRLEYVHAEEPELGGPLAQAKKPVWPRLVAVAALLFGFILIAQITGLAERKPPELIAELREALALSSVGFRDYLIGSAIGLAPPVALFVILFDQATRWLGWTGV